MGSQPFARCGAASSQSSQHPWEGSTSFTYEETECQRDGKMLQGEGTQPHHLPRTPGAQAAHMSSFSHLWVSLCSGCPGRGVGWGLVGEARLHHPWSGLLMLDFHIAHLTSFSTFTHIDLFSFSKNPKGSLLAMQILKCWWVGLLMFTCSQCCQVSQVRLRRGGAVSVCLGSTAGKEGFRICPC